MLKSLLPASLSQQPWPCSSPMAADGLNQLQVNGSASVDFSGGWLGFEELAKHTVSSMLGSPNEYCNSCMLRKVPSKQLQHLN